MLALNKKQIIERLVKVPEKGKRPFWAREMKLLNDLLARRPNMEFWSKIRFPDKYDSLAYLLSEWGESMLRNKYNEFTYKPPKYEAPEIADHKFGEDAKITKTRKTVKDFFNG